MASTFSTNLKIELQATGENSGTWGTITNTNLGTALEQAIVGYGNPSYASDANLTLTYTDTNAAQTARALVLNVTSAVSLTGTRELVVPTIQKQYIVQNNTTGSQSITVKTSAGTGITVPNGRKAHLYVDGTNVIYMDDYVDINGGAIDGTPIGANSAAAGTFTTLGATTGNITTVNATTVDTTNIEVTNLKAKDGTAAGSIADSTGVVTLGSSILTTTDINGGTIDGTTIGGSSAAAGTFTTLTTSSTVTLNGGTANGVLYLNGSKVATSGSALTFDGSSFLVGATSAAAGKMVVKDTASSNTLWLIGRTSDGASSVSFRNAADSAYNARLEGVSNQLIFEVGGSESMRLTSTGLGIGTSSPAYKLDVAESGAPTSTNPFSVARISGSDSVANDLTLLGPNTSQVRIKFGDPEDATIGEVGYDHATNSLRFVTNGAQVGVFNSSGNLGLGVTPSAWGTYKAFETTGNTSLSASPAGAGTAFLTHNGYYDGSNWKYLDNTLASQYRQTLGIHSWYTAASGTAGNTITFTQAMTLDASGNLLVGSTTNSLNARLRVVGATRTCTLLDLTAPSGENWVIDSTNTTGSTDVLGIYASGATGLYIKDTGDVGIGTSSPDNKLEVAVGDNAGINIEQTGANQTGYLNFRDSDGALEGRISYDHSNNSLRFTTSQTERARITSGGNLLVGATALSGVAATFESTQTGSGAVGAAIFANASNASYGYYVLASRTTRSATSETSQYIAWSNDGSDTEFNLRGDGNGYADGTWNNNGADYAEYFESATGGALTVGATVVLDGNKVREATASDPVSAIIGVVRPKEPSKASMVVGNTAWNKWANKYLTDDFDRYIMEDHDVVEWTDADGKAHSYESQNIPDGVTVPADAVRKTHDEKGNKFQHYKLNPAWDKDAEYTPREKRDEWVIIGLVGQVKVLKGKPVNDRWIKMRDVSATVEEWMIR